MQTLTHLTGSLSSTSSPVVLGRYQSRKIISTAKRETVRNPQGFANWSETLSANAGCRCRIRQYYCKMREEEETFSSLLQNLHRNETSSVEYTEWGWRPSCQNLWREGRIFWIRLGFEG